MQFPVCLLYWSNAFWDYCRQSAKLHIFTNPTSLST